MAAREENRFESIKGLRNLPIDPAESICCAAVNSAYELQAKCIVTLTTTGRTARMLSKYRPPCPIVCVTKNAQTARQILLHRQCVGCVTEPATNPADREAR